MNSLSRRLLALLLALLTLASAAHAEEQAVQAYSYTLNFDMDASAYPEADQELLAGIADLLNILHISGVYADDGTGFEHQLSLQLSDNERTLTDFSVYGVPERWWIESSLLGDEKLLINNLALLEFAMKAHAHLGMPLQYPMLLINPFVHTSAFEWILPTWTETFQGEGSRAITKDAAIELAQFIADNGENDRTFYYWVSALTREIGIDTDIFDCLYFLGDWADYVIDDNGIQITVDGATETWLNGADVLFTRTADESSESWQLSLPPADYGHVLTASYEKSGQQLAFALDVMLEEPGDTLALRLTGNGLSEAFPFSGTATLSIDLSGSLMPAPLSLRFKAISDGSYYIVTQTDAVTDAPMLTLTGHIRKAPESDVLAYTTATIEDSFNILSINDASLAELLSRIARPMITGAWPLMVQIPASSFASLFDILDEYGVLDIVISSLQS